jgi:hypothetical protein
VEKGGQASEKRPFFRPAYVIDRAIPSPSDLEGEDSN